LTFVQRCICLEIPISTFAQRCTWMFTGVFPFPSICADGGSAPLG
jgi:hypothetical protein